MKSKWKVSYIYSKNLPVGCVCKEELRMRSRIQNTYFRKELALFHPSEVISINMKITTFYLIWFRNSREGFIFTSAQLLCKKITRTKRKKETIKFRGKWYFLFPPIQHRIRFVIVIQELEFSLSTCPFFNVPWISITAWCVFFSLGLWGKGKISSHLIRVCLEKKVIKLQKVKVIASLWRRLQDTPNQNT